MHLKSLLCETSLGFPFTDLKKEPRLAVCYCVADSSLRACWLAIASSVYLGQWGRWVYIAEHWLQDFLAPDLFM